MNTLDLTIEQRDLLRWLLDEAIGPLRYSDDLDNWLYVTLGDSVDRDDWVGNLNAFINVFSQFTRTAPPHQSRDHVCLDSEMVYREVSEWSIIDGILTDMNQVSSGVIVCSSCERSFEWHYGNGGLIEIDRVEAAA